MVWKHYKNIIKMINVVYLISAILFSFFYEPFDRRLKRKLKNKKIWVRYVVAITVGSVFLTASNYALSYLFRMLGWL